MMEEKKIEDTDDVLETEDVAGDVARAEEETASEEEAVEEALDTAKEEAEEEPLEAAKEEAEEAPEEPAEEAKPAPAPAKKTKSASAKKAAASAKKAKPAAAAATAQATEEEEEDENKLPMKWYVIHTYSGHENKVKENITKMINTSQIQDQFGRLIVPTEEVAEMKKGKKTITTRKFFPSYILIEMFMSDESWHLVNGIPGVTSFVGTATKPQPLSKPEVERILGRMDKDKETIIPEIPFTLGEHIRIKDGPFSDFTGVVDEINAEKGKLRVLVSIFGRETPVELDFLQVESI